jgi:hypothetical protein
VAVRLLFHFRRRLDIQTRPRPSVHASAPPLILELQNVWLKLKLEPCAGIQGEKGEDKHVG